LFYIFFLPPGVMYFFDKIMSISRNKHQSEVLKAELLPSGVTHLRFKKPEDFNFVSGQWFLIACSGISNSEFHPFTITAAPHEEWLSCHIRAAGPWTTKLRSIYDPKNATENERKFGTKWPPVYVDGPFGEGHQNWKKFEYCILIGGGIGVTPFASILKDLIFQVKHNKALPTKGVFFFWVCRNQRQFEWLVEIIRQQEDQDDENVMEVHIFITELMKKFDLRTTMLYVCEKQFQKIQHRSLFTGLRSSTHFGRPNFPDLFHQLQQQLQTSRIGVFSCGPPAMTEGVDFACSFVNQYSGPSFLHFPSNF